MTVLLNKPSDFDIAQHAYQKGMFTGGSMAGQESRELVAEAERLNLAKYSEIKDTFRKRWFTIYVEKSLQSRLAFTIMSFHADFYSTSNEPHTNYLMNHPLWRDNLAKSYNISEFNDAYSRYAKRFRETATLQPNEPHLDDFRI